MATFKKISSNGMDLRGNSFFTTLKGSNSLTSNYSLTFPAADGNSGQLLQYVSAGSLQWIPGQLAYDFWVATNGSDTLGNGSSVAPWQTIQKALNSVPAATDSATMRRVYNINIAAGTYAENLSCDIARKKIVLVPRGMVNVGTYASTGWQPSVKYDITLTCSNSSFDSINPSFAISTVQSATSASTCETFRISGSLIISSTGSQSADVSLTLTAIYGWNTTTGNAASIDATSWSGALTLELVNCKMYGVVSGSALTLQNARKCTFTKLVTMQSYADVCDCTFSAGAMWSAVSGTGVVGFSDCNLSGTFTGSSGVNLLLDDFTNKTFIDNSATVAGSAVKVLLRYYTDSEFWIANSASLTKQLAFSASLITAGNTRTITAPDVDLTLTQYSGPNQSVATTGTPQFAGLTLTGAAQFSAGSVSLPSIYLTTDTTSGIYRIGANNMGVAISAAKVLDIASTGLGVVGTLNTSAGTVSLPAIYMGGDTTSGLYRIGANNIGVAISGAKVLDIASTGIGITGTLSVSSTAQFSTGSVSLPSIYLSTNTTSGIYSIGANNIGVAISAAKVLDIASAGVGITGTLGVSGNVTIGSSKVVMAAATGNTQIAGWLAVGATTTSNTALFYNDANSTNIVEIQNRDTSSGTAAESQLVLSDGVSGTGPTAKFRITGTSFTSTPSQLIIDGNSAISNGILMRLAGSSAISMNMNSVLHFQFLPSGFLALGSQASANYDISFQGDNAKTMGVERAEGTVAGKNLTISSGSATSGGSNLAGGTLQLQPGVSTGTGNSAMRMMRMSRGTTGTTDNTSLEAMYIANSMILGASPVSVFSITCPLNGGSASVICDWCVVMADASNAKTGTGIFALSASSSTTGNPVVTLTENAMKPVARSGGTNAPTITWGTSLSSGVVTATLTYAAGTGLTTPTIRLYITINNFSNQSITMLA